MPNVTYNKFTAGFISEYDINGLLAPDGACKDMSNFEINAPSFALKESKSTELLYNIPAYSGSRIVAHKNWKVTEPSDQEITTLITASSNLLLYSEDFEVDTAWTFTDDGADIIWNTIPSIQGIRMCDQIHNIGDTTKLEQLFNGITGNTYTFSLYFSKQSAHRIRISIVDDVGSTVTTSASATGQWLRLTVTHTCLGTTGFLVRIDFPDGDGDDTCYIWGAQLEVGTVASGYGYTFHYNLPYYIFQRPHYNGVSFVDDWQELTEMRSGYVDLSDDELFTIYGLDGADGYYNNWYVWSNLLTVPTGYITSYITPGVFNFSGLKIADDGTFVVISRFPFFTETPYFQQGLIVEKNITFIEVNNSLKLSFGNTHRPLTIKYIDTSILGVLGGEEVLAPISDIHVGTGWTPSPATPTTLYDKLLVDDNLTNHIKSDLSADFYECGFDSTTETPTVARYEYTSIGRLTQTSVGTLGISDPGFGTTLNDGDRVLMWGGDYTAYIEVHTLGAGQFKFITSATVIYPGWSGYIVGQSYELQFGGIIFAGKVVVLTNATTYNSSTMRADLYCGATKIHEGATHTSLQYDWTKFTENLSPLEVAAIDDVGGNPWSDLRIRFYSSVSDIFSWARIFISGFGSGTGSYSKKEFTLTYSSHIGVQPPSENIPVLPSATLSESEGVGYGTSVITLTAGTSGSLVAGDYKIYVVGLIDGNQRIPIFTDSVTVAATGSIAVKIPVIAAGFDWRLTALEIYIGTGIETPGDTSAYFLYDTILMSDIVGGVLTIPLTDNTWTITVTVTAIDTLQNTLLYNLGGCLDIIETRARYNIAFYLLGRMFIAQTEEVGNIIRYSNIRGIVGEIDKFAYSAMGYGFFTSDSSANQTVMNVGRTIENDLLIIRENDVSLFEVQSGNSSAKRLRQLFTGIGSSNSRSLVISDYGNFWYDDNDIYWYQGGYAVPMKISKDKIRHYWRTTLSTYIATSFAIFNRQVNEYWIFIYDGTRWIVLRYSPEFGNWNIWRPGYTPIWLSEKMDGTLTVSQATNLYQMSTTLIADAPFITTHKRKISDDGISPKQIDEAYITDYSSANNITMAITLDNETSPRTGNSPVFISTKKSQRRSIRQGSSVNFATIKLSTATSGLIQISEFGLVVQTRKDRTSARK